MSQADTEPPMERLLRNRTGLFLKGMGWTAYAREATVFATVSEALRVRRKLGLEDVRLVRLSEVFDNPLHSN